MWQCCERYPLWDSVSWGRTASEAACRLPPCLWTRVLHCSQNLWHVRGATEKKLICDRVALLSGLESGGELGHSRNVFVPSFRKGMGRQVYEQSRGRGGAML